MFVLAEMKDTVRIPPWLFDLKLEDAIIDALNKKFANKVVHNVGLCVTLWDLTRCEDSFIFPGDGSSHTVVHFRYVVFRPFMDEILLGKIRSCSREGVHGFMQMAGKDSHNTDHMGIQFLVSMGFFDDILIPSDALQHPARFDAQEQLWVWQYETEEGPHDLFMDIGEEIRFRVVDETFVDTTPSGPEVVGEKAELKEPETKKTPFSMLGSISEPGLGLLSWWNNT